MPDVSMRLRSRTMRAVRESRMLPTEQEFNDFFDTVAVPVHFVGPDGTILRANRAELELLGFARAEYVGRNIAEFHADAAAINDILRRLTAGETLRDYPAR